MGSIFARVVVPKWREQRALHAVLAETDRRYPGWRLDELEAAQRKVSDPVNGALRVSAAARLLPLRWQCKGGKPSDAEERRQQWTAIAKVAPARCFIPGVVQALEADLAQVGSALTEARPLVNMPQGRFPVAWADDGISTRLPQLAMTRDVVNLLAYEVLVRSQKQETSEALDACRALLNVGRSIGDEPAAVSQRFRMDIRITACEHVELALAHGHVSENALAALQCSIESEEAEPLLVTGIKGERAIMDRLLASVKSGGFSPRQVRNSTFFSTVLYLFRHTDAMRTAHLRLCLKAEEAASKPTVEQLASFRELERTALDLPPDVQAIVPAFRQLAAAFQGSRARLRCALVAVAAERYRIARGLWPKNLAILAPEYLASIPADPFGEGPLQMARCVDGIVIYSAGADGRDHGGATEATSPDASRDERFRLWHPHRRHQPSGENDVGPPTPLR